MRTIKVLCAIRDGRVVRALREALEARCEFEWIADGAKAYAYALREIPDILVADAVLASLDGVGLIENLKAALGSRMPRVIGGSVGRFADEAFARAGAQRTLEIPWRVQHVQKAIEALLEDMDQRVDWACAQADYERACSLLRFMGMSDKLRGFTYLAWAGALTSEDEARLYAIGERLYTPIAQHEHASAQAVERLIRHAVERTTDTVGKTGIYTFFGNTIDPMRGKPTNAQMIAMLAQRIRCAKN